MFALKLNLPATQVYSCNNKGHGMYSAIVCVKLSYSLCMGFNALIQNIPIVLVQADAPGNLDCHVQLVPTYSVSNS